ncbi:hypothetical protein PCNPT3_10700 [Psychromonas sp. CNPT3]|uniref:class I SAM-dependent methyltransferase n=1 Tax=Psychromonas sp. CNPT3 TaxID=314282 RepID=UPI00006E78C9|nr:class I SAM-dependent methyltransferase [Psychromonas sp. CNPT3]AGH82078.1 hypothetical protein PCNPT3_10700 [Psychromonas sp. CNPT3]
MSIQYYQNNADIFFENTVGVDMEELYQPFISRLPKNALILDAGCGSGRDSKAFISKGFRVDAFDASSEMVKRAKDLTGLDVQFKRFEEVDDVAHYDAIWACASLLHVPEKELATTFEVLSNALKSKGIFYVSFKLGENQREKDGRIFTDMTEERLKKLLSNFLDLSVININLTEDKRPTRNEVWLNALLIKSVKHL